MPKGIRAKDTLTTEQRTILATRLASQQLSGRAAGSATEVVGQLLAVQAQDPRGARLTVRSRSAGVLAADVDRALSKDRSLVITWLNRGTLHLVTADDYWWLHPLTTPQLATFNQRRLRQERVSARQAERGVEVITDAVTAGGPQSRHQLRDRLDRANVPTAGQALAHLLLASSLAGRVVRGPATGPQPTFAAVASWLGPAPAPLARRDALGRLARRYLAGHAPASAQDLAKWAGITLSDARRGLAAIADETTPLSDDLVRLATDRLASPSALPPPRLLGPFDPLLHGWTSRELFVGPHRSVVTTNGVFRPVALVRGRVAATWGLANGIVSIHRLEPVGRTTVDALRRDASAVLEFLGLPDKPATVT